MFSYFSLVNEAFDMALSGLIVIGGLVLVAVLRYVLRRYRNFIVARERRQAGAASLSNPQLMPGRAAEQRREALRQLFRTAEPAEDIPPILMEELVRRIKKEPVTPPRAQSMPVLTPTNSCLCIPYFKTF